LGEIIANVGNLEAFADDRKIGILSGRDYLGPCEVGAATCAALIGDTQGVVHALKARPSGWFLPSDIAIIQERLLAAITEGKCTEIAGWRSIGEARRYEGKV
jgi:hypothetical protein